MRKFLDDEDHNLEEDFHPDEEFWTFTIRFKDFDAQIDLIQVPEYDEIIAIQFTKKMFGDSVAFHHWFTAISKLISEF